MEVRLVDTDVARRHAGGRRTKWSRVLDLVREAPAGKVVEVVLWPEGELPRNHRARLYGVAALLRQKARQRGMQIHVYHGHDGRRIFVEPVA